MKPNKIINIGTDSKKQYITLLRKTIFYICYKMYQTMYFGKRNKLIPLIISVCNIHNQYFMNLQSTSLVF